MATGKKTFVVHGGYDFDFADHPSKIVAQMDSIRIAWDFQNPKIKQICTICWAIGCGEIPWNSGR